DRPDHPRLERPVGMLDDERVQVILRGQDVVHPPVLGQHADADDAPVEGLAVVHQPVEVHRLVRTVEAADAEVHDPGTDRRTAVARYGDVVAQGTHCRGREGRHLTAPSDRPWTSLSWAANPAISTGSDTTIEAAQTLARNNP